MSDIEISDVPTVRVLEDNIIYEWEWEGKKVSLPSHTANEYAKVFEKERTFWDRFKRFLTAQNQAGRVSKTVKEAVLIFTPFGRQIESMTDLVTKMIEDTMPQEEKAKSKSKTIIAFGLLFLVGLLQKFGLDLGLEMSPDAEWISIASGVVGVILRLVTDKPVKLGETLKKVFRK